MARLDVPTLIVSDAAAFRAWLDANRDRSEGVWLVLAKKGVTDPTSLTYAQALEEALCQGWIDGQKLSAWIFLQVKPRCDGCLPLIESTRVFFCPLGVRGYLCDDPTIRGRGLRH